MELNLDRKVKFDDEFLKSILRIAFEGGSRFWVDHIDFFLRDELDKPENESDSTWAFTVLQSGGSIAVFDEEDEDDNLQPLFPMLNMDKLISGVEQVVKLYIEDPTAPLFHGCDIFSYDNETLKSDSFGAGLSDAVIQYGMFNEIAYKH